MLQIGKIRIRQERNKIYPRLLQSLDDCVYRCCFHSGSFPEPLYDPNTPLIVSAASMKSSNDEYGIRYYFYFCSLFRMSTADLAFYARRCRTTFARQYTRRRVQNYRDQK